LQRYEEDSNPLEDPFLPEFKNKHRKTPKNNSKSKKSTPPTQNNTLPSGRHQQERTREKVGALVGFSCHT